MTNATIKLEKERRKGKARPVLHVLTSDGETATFRDRGIVLLDNPADGDKGLYLVLMTGDGEVFQTPDGKDAIMQVPVVTVSFDDSLNADQLVTGWKAIAEFIGVSEKTAKRMAEDGRLPKPSKHAGPRHVSFTLGELRKFRNQQASD